MEFTEWTATIEEWEPDKHTLTLTGEEARRLAERLHQLWEHPEKGSVPVYEVSDKVTLDGVEHIITEKG